MDHQVVSREEWTEASKRLLAEEKHFTKARDRLNAARQALPWVKVEKPYRFETADGTRTLAELIHIAQRPEHAVYGFLYGLVALKSLERS